MCPRHDNRGDGVQVGTSNKCWFTKHVPTSRMLTIICIIYLVISASRIVKTGLATRLGPCVHRSVVVL